MMRSTCSLYGWIITKDLIEDGKSVGVTGPGDVGEGHLALLKAGQGVKFRMKDDDGIVYYYGRLVSIDTVRDLPHGDEAFGPLDDFGTPNTGCTSIEYKNAKGEWETL